MPRNGFKSYRPQLEILEKRLAPAVLPPGFSETLIAGGLMDPSALEIAPDGRLFVTQQSGQVRIIRDGTLLPTPFVTLSVDATQERGLVGITLDPNFATNQFVYVYYTVPGPTIGGPGAHNRLSRFTANGDVAMSGSQTVLLDLEPVDSIVHNGGGLRFGPDGKLYVGVGDDRVGAYAQALANRQGKVLRLNADGTIPADNPTTFPNVSGTTTGVHRAIWAIGLRNPFSFAFQPGTGRLFLNDVGLLTTEEIDEGVAGSNYGWPLYEGASSPTDLAYRDPIYQYPHMGDIDICGGAVVGAAFYDPTARTFPPSYAGHYFFGDLCHGWLRRLDPADHSVTEFATGISIPVALKVAADGSLYYLARGAGGQLFRVQYHSANRPPALAPLADRTVPLGQLTLTVPLSASDPDGDPLTFTATAESLAYTLDRRLALYTTGDLFENFGGRAEKWLKGAGGPWYFILPNGELNRWDGNPGANGPLVANVGASYHASPSLLYDAVPDPHATLSIVGTTLTITREAGFVGALVVTVTVSDGPLIDRQTFTVIVANPNQPPVLAAIADQAVPSSQLMITVALSATDLDGDPLTFSATAQSLAYLLTTQYGLTSYVSLWDNSGGRNEKWLLNNLGQWFFILPNGELYRWDGGAGATGTLVGTPGASYHTDPNQLLNAPINQPRASLSLVGNMLTILRDPDWISSLVVTAVVSDGQATDSKSFVVTVTHAG